MEITLLYLDDCPNWRLAAERLEAVIARNVGHRRLTVQHRRVGSGDDAVRLGFLGSPSLQVDGVDLFPDPSAQVGLACRRYRTPTGFQGVPAVDQIEQAIGAAGARVGGES